MAYYSTSDLRARGIGEHRTRTLVSEERRRVEAETFCIACSRLPSRIEVRGLPVVEALWAARSAPEFAQRILERHYAGNQGNERLNADLKRMKRVPAWLRAIIKRTPVGSRSELERRVARPLLARGYRVQMNQPAFPASHRVWDWNRTVGGSPEISFFEAS